MNPLIDKPTVRQRARDWSSKLGTTAAEHATAPVFPTPLATILAYLRQRNRDRQDSHDTLRAHQIVMGA